MKPLMLWETKYVREGGNSVRRAIDVIGAQVINVDSGQIIGRVDDLLFDREGRLQGLLLTRRSWFTKQPYLPLSDIMAIGEDVVTVNKELQLGKENISTEWVHVKHGELKMLGIPVVTANGKQLGLLEDVYFQEELGTIIGYEISDGFFSDVMEGRRTIKKPSKLLIGKDAFIVDAPSEQNK